MQYATKIDGETIVASFPIVKIVRGGKGYNLPFKAFTDSYSDEQKADVGYHQITEENEPNEEWQVNRSSEIQWRDGKPFRVWTFEIDEDEKLEADRNEARRVANENHKARLIEGFVADATGLKYPAIKEDRDGLASTDAAFKEAISIGAEVEEIGTDFEWTNGSWTRLDMTNIANFKLAMLRLVNTSFAMKKAELVDAGVINESEG